MSLLGFTWVCAKKDLRRRAQDPLALLLWLAIPAVIGGLMSTLFGGSDGPKPRAQILLVDQDQSFLTQMLGGAGGPSGGGDSPFVFESVELEAGRERIDAGDGTALLVIPEGFTEAVLREEPVVLELVTNPAQRILPGMAEEALAILSEGAFYLHRLFGDELRTLIDGPEDGADFFEDLRVAELSASINRRMRGLDQYLFPAAIELETELLRAPTEEAPSPGFGQLFFPGLLFMMLFFMAQGQSEDLWSERSAGTLRRVVTTPGQTGGFLLGKLLAIGVIIALLTGLAAALGAWAFDLEFVSLLPGLVWAVATGVVMTLVMFVVQLFASTQRAGNLLGNVIVFPLLMAGGSFFPFEAMPGGMADIGRSTPNGWALMQMKSLFAGELAGAALGSAVLWLVVTALVLFAFCSWRLRRSFATES